MNKIRVGIGVIILLLAIPAILHGNFSGYSMAFLCIGVGLKLIADGLEH